MPVRDEALLRTAVMGRRLEQLSRPNFPLGDCRSHALETSSKTPLHIHLARGWDTVRRVYCISTANTTTAYR
jgi:hypothetical protein